MSTRKKADSTLLKEARARIEELEKELKSSKASADMYRDRYTKLDHEVQSVHTALDSVGVPREIKSPGSYCSTTTMDLTARLFAWRMGGRIGNQEEV